MRHHPGGVVLEDMAVIHPTAGPVIGQPAMRTVLLVGTLTTSSQERQGGGSPFTASTWKNKQVALG
jgi:hypothetical protein